MSVRTRASLGLGAFAIGGLGLTGDMRRNVGEFMTDLVSSSVIFDTQRAIYWQ